MSDSHEDSGVIKGDEYDDNINISRDISISDNNNNNKKSKPSQTSYCKTKLLYMVPFQHSEKYSAQPLLKSL